MYFILFVWYADSNVWLAQYPLMLKRNRIGTCIFTILLWKRFNLFISDIGVWNGSSYDALQYTLSTEDWGMNMESKGKYIVQNTIYYQAICTHAWYGMVIDSRSKFYPIICLNPVLCYALMYWIKYLFAYPPSYNF